MDEKRPRRVGGARAGKTSARTAAPTLPDGVTTPDQSAEFIVVAEPGATSTIAISTALADEDVLAAAAAEAPVQASATDVADTPAPLQSVATPEAEHFGEVPEQAAAPVFVEPETAVALLSEAESSPEPDTAVSATADMIAAATPFTEPAVEAAPVPDVPSSPPSSQLAQTIGHSPTQPQKDMIMDMTTNFGGGLNDMMSGAQDKAKEAFEKSSSMMGEAGSFARGNVEAVVESGKILAAGLQDMSTNLVAEGRTSFETMTADLKELAASKTPADFFKTQSEIMRKSLDSAVAYGSKNSEAMLKLVSDMMAPLSGRMNMAVEKVKMPLA